MTEEEVQAYVSSLIHEAQGEKIQPAAHVMHILAGNIEAGNLTDIRTTAEILLEASRRSDRELASHPLPEGYSWCSGCGSSTGVLIDNICPECHREHLAGAIAQRAP